MSKFERVEALVLAAHQELGLPLLAGRELSTSSAVPGTPSGPTPRTSIVSG